MSPPGIQNPPRVLVSGLCSVGKSSFVSALWGDAELLPTAVRDCTQTNTLIRAPRAGESDRQIRLAYLSREQALNFAAKGLAFYRIAEVLQDELGLAAPKLDELPAEARLRTALETLQRLYAQRPEVLVLNEYLTDEVSQLEEFLAFVDSADFQPERFVAARWEDRRELLMGRRRLDGRVENVGKLWALRHVELIRDPSPEWNGAAPELIDTPWIPAFHNARRTELIVEQALLADALVILALPQRYEPEAWVHNVFRKRPELTRRTLVVFNQIDTIDGAALFAREGFAQAFEENAVRLEKMGIPRANLCMSCARLPFLELNADRAATAERREKLVKVLKRIAALIETRPAGEFKSKLAAACNPVDAGLGPIRERIKTVQRTA